MKKVFVPLVATCLALAMGACTPQSEQKAGPSAGKTSAGEATFDFSTIKADPEVEKLVPQKLKDTGVLKNGASTDYAPAEFLLDDNHTPTGYEVDMVKAIALTMGLKDGTTTTETFEGLLPKVGTIYDVGASTFNVTPERLKAYNMVAYMDMGTQYATAKGNPGKFDPKDPCGKTIGTQTGTTQESEILPKLNEKCTADGKEPIKIQQEDNMSNVYPKVISGQYDAVIADSPVIGYIVEKAGGQLETAGELFDSAPIGIAINKDNPELAQAVKAALDSLLKSGQLQKIFAQYGADEALYKQVEIKTDAA